MLAGLALGAVLWLGKFPGLSTLVHESESDWGDRVAGMLEPTPERDDLVFLAIDEDSLSLSGLDEADREKSVLPHFTKQWPWNRKVWAAAIDRLGEAGAKLIVIDIVLKNLSADDEAENALIEAIGRHRDKVVLASYIEEKPPTAKGVVLSTFAEPNEEYLGPLDDETMSGFVNFWRSSDGQVRNTTYRLSLREANKRERHPDEHVFESVAAVAGRKMGALPPEGSLRLRFATRGKKVDGVRQREISSVYRPRSLYRIFHEPDWVREFGNGDFFKDKVVLIGPSAPVFQDKKATPAGTIDGGQLHLQALGCLLSNSFLKEAPAYWHWGGLVLMALVGGTLVTVVRNPILVIVISLVALGIWMAGVVFIADQTSILAGGVTGVLGLSLVVVFGQSFEFLQERIERNRLFGQLSRSVSKDVAAAMVRSPDGYLDTAKGGRRRIVVLFSDIRDFTKRSEREDPETLVAQLNEYLTAMVQIIFDHGGTLDKFIGDAIMATWGGIEDTRSEVMAEAAVKAAAEMCAELERMNLKWKEEGRDPFAAGIGIHIGDAVIGEVGSRQRSDFTAIGDAVNLASRIEGMTKMLGVPILVSGDVANLQPSRAGLSSLGRFRVKGRHEPVEVVAANIRQGEAFREALTRLGQGDLVQAEGVLLELSSGSEMAGPAKFYLQQMEVWKKEPKAEWDGVINLDSK